LLALRNRLSASGPLQGAALPANALAAELGVSSTPVREALAWLAGEGLICRTRSGYAARIHDRVSLVELYGLLSVLSEVAVRGGLLPPAVPSVDESALLERGDGLDRLASRVANLALAASITRAFAQLAPFRRAEEVVLGGQEREALSTLIEEGASAGLLARALRAFYRRRARHAGEILTSALGLS
jgi:DNA-binding Lrp family transcriptional regulator